MYFMEIYVINMTLNILKLIKSVLNLPKDSPAESTEPSHILPTFLRTLSHLALDGFFYG